MSKKKEGGGGIAKPMKEHKGAIVLDDRGVDGIIDYIQSLFREQSCQNYIAKDQITNRMSPKCQLIFIASHQIQINYYFVICFIPQKDIDSFTQFRYEDAEGDYIQEQSAEVVIALEAHCLRDVKYLKKDGLIDQLRTAKRVVLVSNSIFVDSVLDGYALIKVIMSNECMSLEDYQKRYCQNQIYWYELHSLLMNSGMIVLYKQQLTSKRISIKLVCQDQPESSTQIKKSKRRKCEKVAEEEINPLVNSTEFVQCLLGQNQEIQMSVLCYNEKIFEEINSILESVNQRVLIANVMAIPTLFINHLKLHQTAAIIGVQIFVQLIIQKIKKVPSNEDEMVMTLKLINGMKEVYLIQGESDTEDNIQKFDRWMNMREVIIDGNIGDRMVYFNKQKISCQEFIRQHQTYQIPDKKKNSSIKNNNNKTILSQKNKKSKSMNAYNINDNHNNKKKLSEHSIYQEEEDEIQNICGMDSNVCLQKGLSQMQFHRQSPLTQTPSSQFQSQMKEVDDDDHKQNIGSKQEQSSNQIEKDLYKLSIEQTSPKNKEKSNPKIKAIKKRQKQKIEQSHSSETVVSIKDSCVLTPIKQENESQSHQSETLLFQDILQTIEESHASEDKQMRDELISSKKSGNQIILLKNTQLDVNEEDNANQQLQIAVIEDSSQNKYSQESGFLGNMSNLLVQLMGEDNKSEKVRTPQFANLNESEEIKDLPLNRKRKCRKQKSRHIDSSNETKEEQIPQIKVPVLNKENPQNKSCNNQSRKRRKLFIVSDEEVKEKCLEQWSFGEGQNEQKSQISEGMRQKSKKLIVRKRKKE